MKRRALSEKVKAHIAKLVDKNFAKKVFAVQLPKYYKDFYKIKVIELDPYKRHLGVTSAVFVVEYRIKYLTRDGHTKSLDLFASAHSDGSRYGAYQKTKVLYKQGFAQGKFRVTKPLFYLRQQKAFVYESSPGRSFFNFFTQEPRANLKPALKLITGWISKLHNFDFSQEQFVWPQFSIGTMVPPPDKFIVDFLQEDKRQGQIVKKLVREMRQFKKKINSRSDQTLIYGDYHPENVIMTDLRAKHLTMIDFTDIALGDPMIDLGTFLQQFDFMGHNFISRHKINEYKEFFVSSYFDKAFAKIDINYLNRINLYQSWTALRTAVFLFYMKDVENPVDDLIADSINYLDCALKNKRKINLH